MHQESSEKLTTPFIFQLAVRILLLTAMFWSGVVNAEAEIAVINNLENPVELDQYLYTLKDSDIKFSLEDVVSGDLDRWFVKNEEGVFVGDTRTGRYWFKMRLLWQGDDEYAGKKVVLAIPSQPMFLQEMLIQFTFADGEKRSFTTGFQSTYDSRDIDTLTYSFRMPMEKGEVVDVVGYVDSKIATTPIFLSFVLHTQETFDRSYTDVLNVLFIFYSVMAALFFYNLCIFLALRERVYGIYLLFLMTATLGCAFQDGITAKWLLGDSPQLNVRLAQLNGILCAFIYVVFIYHALNRVAFWPKYTKFYRLVCAFGWVCMFATSVASDLNVGGFMTLYYPSFAISLCTAVIIYGVYRREPVTVYLLVAESFVTFGPATYMLSINGILPINTITKWSLHGGFLGEALLLSLALAARARYAQNAAIDNLKKYEALYRQSNEGLFQYDLVTKQLQCNNAFAQLYGYENKDSLIGESDHEDAGIAPIFNDLLREYNGQVSGYELALPGRDKESEIWVSLSMRLVRDHDGQPHFVDGAMVDITERKLKERAEKDNELSEARNQAKSQFFAAMNHELRTPLTAILGYADAASGDVGSNEKQRALETIGRSGNHLLQIINDILDISKVEAQKMDMEFMDVNLLEVMSDIRDYFSILASQKNLEFSIDYQLPLPCSFTCDPTRLKQTLINLCGNSIKFTEKGGVSLHVGYSQEKSIMIFSIVDTGIGLKQEQLAGLFDAFTQADQATTRHFGGSGLGLHLSKQLAMNLGGDITVESIYGQGSTFTLTVASGDLGQADWITEALLNQERQKTQAIASGDSVVPAIGHHELKVLVAEDNPEIQALVELYLKREGVDVVSVADGVDAIALARTEEFDLILMDMQMPHCNGLDAVAMLKAKGFEQPIYALTANESEAAIEQCQLAGCDGHMSKPLDIDKLRELIHSLR